MKILVASALLAVCLAACTSDLSTTTIPVGTTPANGACKKSSDCEPSLQCAYPTQPSGGVSSCRATGICMAIASCNPHLFCPCGGGPANPVVAAISACSDGAHAPEPVDTTVTATDAGTCSWLDGGPTVPDGGALDGGALDGGAPDGGDSGAPDGGDGGTPDTGAPDSGTVPDGGAEDAGPDGGPVDAGPG